MTTNKPAPWMRPRTPLLLGAAALTACLVVDATAIAIGAALAGTAAIVLEPLAGILIASGAILAIVIGVRRRRQSGATCSTTGLCATIARWWFRVRNGSKATKRSCTLDNDVRIARAEVFRDLFRKALKHRDATDERAVWTFAWSPEIETEVRALATAESACCSFTTTDIRRTADELHWELTAPPQARTMLALLDDVAKEAMSSYSRT